MRSPMSRQWWSFVLGVWVVWQLPAIALPPSSTPPAALQIQHLPSQQAQTLPDLVAAIAQAQVVYLAETHASEADHQAQLQLVRSLQGKRPLILGLEMFQRPFQGVLNQYLAGQISEVELRQKTEYDRRWGYDWELYAPILRYARQHQIPVVALNTPSEVTRKVARQGLDALSLADRQWIPPRSSILAEPPAYRQRIQQIYDEMHQGKGNSANFEKFFLAQVLWDETMADTIATTLQRSPNALMVVLAGQGHILYGHGIPSRVARRLNPKRRQPLRQVSVILNPDPALPTTPAIADYFWFGAF